MRDPKQEARRIPHGYKDAPEGKLAVVLYHEVDGVIDCEPGDSYGDAANKAAAYIDKHYPGRHL